MGASLQTGRVVRPHHDVVRNFLYFSFLNFKVKLFQKRKQNFQMRTLITRLELYITILKHNFVTHRRLALPLWVLTIVLFFILLKYGAYFLMLTGGVMVIANILWASIRNVNELIIPFSAEHKLEFHFGPSFYLNLITGLDLYLCVNIMISR